MPKPTCYFCKNSYYFTYFDLGPSSYYQYREKQKSYLLPAFVPDAGNVWICGDCNQAEWAAFKDRGYKDPRFKTYDECIYKAGSLQDNSGFTNCLQLMYEQQLPLPRDKYPIQPGDGYAKKTWDKVCVPCKAYYQLLNRNNLEYAFVKAPETPFSDQIFIEWFAKDTF